VVAWAETRMTKIDVELCTEVEEYLGMKKKTTAMVYRSGLKHFITLFKEKYGEDQTFSDFLDMLEENAGLPRNSKRKLAEAELVDFIDYLQKKNLSNKTIRTYIAPVQDFLNYKDFTISVRWLGNLPPSTPQKRNQKHQWKLSEVKEFVDKAQTYRDKAIILTLFQSGISISDLCELTFGDVKQQIGEGNLPLI